MKPHRRGITRITWFKLTVCACLAAMAASLFTPYPAQIIRALKGEPEPATDAPDAYPPHTSLPPEQPDQTQTAAPGYCRTPRHGHGRCAPAVSLDAGSAPSPCPPCSIRRFHQFCPPGRPQERSRTFTSWPVA